MHTTTEQRAQERDALAAAIVREVAQSDPKRTYLPLKEWPEKYWGLQAAVDEAWRVIGVAQEALMAAIGEEGLRGPAVHAAQQEFNRVGREILGPANQSLREFYSSTMYYVYEPPPGYGPAPREQKSRGVNKGQSTGDLRRAILSALGENPGQSKAALCRAVAGEEARAQRRATTTLEKLIAEGVIRYEAPEVRGGPGRCWRVEEPSEVPLGE